MRFLVVTAVPAERDAIARCLPAGCDVELVVGGVGPAAAAAATAEALSGTNGVDLALSAGIGGGFAPLRPGEVAVACTIAFADLGAETADGFRGASELGFGADSFDVTPALAVQLADRTGGHVGTIVTVATVTGTAATADARRVRHPDVVAEGMEGAGVAVAATRRGVAFAEIRAISNMVGPRDRSAWQIPAALEALGPAVASIVQ